jgi:probable F420-dependent oxidoreductase
VKLGFAMPNLIQLKAMHQKWEDEVTGAEQSRLARWAEKLGYEMISSPEHFVIPVDHVELSGSRYPNAFTAMAFWAGATERIRVNSCVALLPLQNPIVTAKALSTLDWLSGGRVTVTFGVGWLKEEFDALGVPFHKRGRIADEYLQVIMALWTQDVAEFEGEYVSFKDMVFDPKPLQQPHLPIWFGGDSDPMLRRVARYASGWWPFLTRPEDIPAKLQYIQSHPDYSGQLTDVFYGVGTARVGEGHVIQDDPHSRPGMSTQELVDELGWLSDLGVTISSVPMPRVSDIQGYYEYTHWVAEEVMPVIDPY